MVPATRFTDPIAVEAWDAWFRWRDGDVLRDVTIDDTWWRVAGAVSGADGAMAPLWAHHYVDAFSRWRLLPDERLLRWAGTGQSLGDFDAPGAVLNVAAFVTVPLGAEPRFDRTGFLQTAALAVRLLDDALLMCHAPAPSGLHVGIIGLGDALRRLGSPYAGREARAHAQAIAAALAEGCLQGAVDLAEERGCPDPTDPASLLPWHKRGMPPSLLERASRFGLRHLQLTAIDRHPMLARLANNTTDGLDPVPPSVNTPRNPAEGVDTAQRDIRAAMQPWIDKPIDFFHDAPSRSHADLPVAGTAGATIW